MLEIPEEIKELYRKDNISVDTKVKLKLRFYGDDVDTLYPYETLWPAEDLFPEEHEGEPWLTIENDQIVTETFNLTESLSSSDEMEYGSCETAKFEITVADIIEELTGKEFMASITIGDYEMAFGVYTVESFVRQADRRKRKITAYDNMRKFDTDVAVWYNELVFPMTIKQFRDSLCAYVGVLQSQQTLVFDDLEISKTIEPEQISGRDVLQAICQINGCFGHVDKTGKLVYVMLQQTGLYPAEDLWPEETLYPSEFGSDGQPVEFVDYYKDLQYEDYLVDGISGLTIRQEEGDIGANVGTGDNPYIIEGNFLVYGKSAVELLNIAQSLLPYISGRIYKPATLECYGMPWLEVGDAIRVRTRDDMVETFVMNRIMKGTQALMDTIEATGSKAREEVFGINKKIIQLEGKSAVLTANVEEVSARVTDLKEETEAQFKITAEQISAEVKAREDGDTVLSGRIDVTDSNITAEVTRAKGEEEKLSGRINVTSEQITAEVTRATKAEGELSGRITVNADNITAEVTRAKGAEGTLSGRIDVTAGQITAEVTRATKAEGELSGRITVNADNISLKVSKGSVSSEISAETGQVTIRSNRLVVDSTNFKLDSLGNATFSGNVTGATVTGTSISGGTITGTNIYGGDDIPFSATRGRVRIGDFYVDDDYGRHIFQSYDEVTGMSTGDVSRGQLLLWAGYGMSSRGDAYFLVNNGGQTHVYGSLWLNGRNILDYIESSCTDDCDCDTGYEDPCDICSVVTYSGPMC